MVLKDFINRFVIISPSDMQIIIEHFKTKDFSKGEKLHKKGNVCNRLFIIEKGMARSFFINEKGKDISIWFFSEKEAVTSVESFFKRSPSKYDIEALEDTTVHYITYDDLQKLFNKFHSFERFGRLLAIQMLTDLAHKLNAIQFQSAEERYKFLLKKHPNIAFRVPLKHIASYLGITQETLSRVRAK